MCWLWLSTLSQFAQYKCMYVCVCIRVRSSSWYGHVLDILSTHIYTFRLTMVSMITGNESGVLLVLWTNQITHFMGRFWIVSRKMPFRLWIYQQETPFFLFFSLSHSRVQQTTNETSAWTTDSDTEAKANVQEKKQKSQTFTFAFNKHNFTQFLVMTKCIRKMN